MIPAPRLRLKRSSGWFAAGQEVATALPMLSDAAFKLYVFLCLNVTGTAREWYGNRWSWRTCCNATARV